MPTNDNDKLNRLEELKSKLFSKSYQVKLEHRGNFSHSKSNNIPDAWDDVKDTEDRTLKYEERFFMKTTIFKNFFIASLVFFVVTLGYASYVFFAGGNTVSNDNIDISVLGNNFTAGGEDLSLVVGITNRNNSAIDLADLILEYPKGSSDIPDASTDGGTADPSLGTETSRMSLGTIPAGAVRNENIKLVLFGQQGSIRPIKISLEYRVEGSNAIFVKEKMYNVTINSTPLDLSVSAPSTISPNQDITLSIKTTLNASKPISKILLKVDYPVGFQFKSSVPAPSLGNNTWNLGDLAPGAERTISVTGKMIDVVDGEEKSFHITSGSQSTSDKSMIDVVFNSIAQKVAIKKPFIEAKLVINGISGREYAVDNKTPIRGQIMWTNNLDTKVDDVVIRATISGNAVDRKTINTPDGFYDSSKNTITWDKNSVSGFKEVNPGDSGIVSFTLSPLSLFSSTSGLLSSPSVNVDISISGKQSVVGYATSDLSNSDTGVVHIISDVGFTSKVLYYSGVFKNTGPIPPKVEKQTTYTVQWSLSNTANSISKAVIRSSLPSWINFVGPISPSDADLVYNPSTKEIVWNIGSIAKGTGITTPAKSVSFQISFTPSLSQVATTPLLLNDSVLTGHDDFANVDVKVSKGSSRTSLDNDPLFPPNGALIVE